MPHPLHTVELQTIDACLDDGQLEQAQRLLARVGEDQDLELATSYLATRLLFLRQRLDPQSVVERMRELLDRAAPFPQAEALLHQATQQLGPEPPPNSEAHGPRGAAAFAARPTQRAPSYIPASSLAPRKTSSAPSAFPSDAPVSISVGPPLPSEAPGSMPSVSTSVSRPSPQQPPPMLAEASAPPDDAAPPPPLPARVPPAQPHLGLGPTNAEPPPTRSGNVDPGAAAGAAAGAVSTSAALAGIYDNLHLRAPLAPTFDPAPGSAIPAAEAGFERSDSFPLSKLPTVRANGPLPLGTAGRSSPTSPAASLSGALSHPERRESELPRRLEIDTRQLHRPPRGVSQPPGRWGHDSARPLVEGRYSAAGTDADGALPPPMPANGQRVAIPRPEKRRVDSADTASGSTPAASVSPSSGPIGQTGLVKRAVDADTRYAYSLRPGPVDSLRPPAPDLKPRSAPPSSRAPRSSRLPRSSDPPSRRNAPTCEQQLWQGNNGPALTDLDAQARQLLLHRGSKPNLTELAKAGSELLSKGPVTHLFAPHDQSLYGLERLELACQALLGSQPAPFIPPNLLLVLGAYLGETLRHTQRGRWHGDPAKLLTMRVRAEGHTWHPFRLLRERFATSPLKSLVPRGDLPRVGTQPWFENRPAGDVRRLWVSPPAAVNIPRLARQLGESPLSRAAEACFGNKLDQSSGSVAALAALFERLIQSSTTLSGKEPWLQKLCILVGAYLGELIRARSGGEWSGNDQLSDPVSASNRDPVARQRRALESYRLTIGERETRPMAVVLRHAVCQQPEQLVKYAAEALRVQ